MVDLFALGVPAINKHLKNIFDQGSCRKNQLFPFWKQLLLTAKATCAIARRRSASWV